MQEHVVSILSTEGMQKPSGGCACRFTQDESAVSS